MENLKESILDQIRASYEIKQAIHSNVGLVNTLTKVCEVAIKIYRNGGKILLAGNGGSAADAQHIAAEFVGRFYKDRAPLPAMALTVNSSALTAISNDYGYGAVFSRQVEAFGQKGDIFIGISTSGSSQNVLEAIEAAHRQGLLTVGFTGRSGGKMLDLCDFCLRVPADETPRIQESHILFGHIICAAVEAALFE